MSAIDDLIQKDSKMESIINEIRDCKLDCYKNKYDNPLRTNNNRIITTDELMKGKPLIDEWRRQDILFISQSPSRQAWADSELSSKKNSFLMKILLPKFFPNRDLDTALKVWKFKVFWIHSADCYPYVFINGRNKNRDRLPNMKCANKYLDRVLFNMQPRFIILMSWCSTKYFANSIKHQIGSKRVYPSLEEILEWQYKNKEFLKVKAKNELNIYEAWLYLIVRTGVN